MGASNETTRVFEATTRAGACPLCREAFAPGVEAVFTTGHEVEGVPTPLPRALWAVFLAFAARRKAARKLGGATPTPPAWLWENMTHPGCAERIGFRVPRLTGSGGYARTVAYTGTRTRGHADGRAANV